MVLLGVLLPRKYIWSTSSFRRLCHFLSLEQDQPPLAGSSRPRHLPRGGGVAGFVRMGTYLSQCKQRAILVPKPYCNPQPILL